MKKLLVVLFFVVLFFLAATPPDSFDILAHIKIGEYITKKGIFSYDIFSHSAQGRTWYPYEWVFQVAVYQFKMIFGFDALRYLVGFFAVYMVGIIYLILRRIFKLQTIYSLVFCFFFFVMVDDFFTARPHIVAYSLLLTNLYLILLYVFKNKNFLWLTLPITLIWANLHASIVLDVYLFAGFTITLIVKEIKFFRDKNFYFRIIKERNILIVYTILTFIFTILPPLGFTQYRLLLYFFQNRVLISRFINEWASLTQTPYIFIIYLSISIVLSVLFFIINLKKKTLIKNLRILIFFPFLIAGFTAQRNLFIGYVGITIIGASIFSEIIAGDFLSKKTVLTRLFLILGIAFLVFLFIKKQTPSLPAPQKGMEFIRNHAFEGNIFYEFDYGSFFLYHLYPKYKIFTDIRTELYLCCEMHDMFDLALYKNLPDQAYKKIVDRLWDRYHISFAILTTHGHNVFKKVERIVNGDEAWRLVYWDDQSEIFVRNDGNNKKILSAFAAYSATPYLPTPFRDGMIDQSLKEYQKMVSITDSARSRNAIGFIFFKQGKFEEAKKQFERAIDLDPTFESPYMNLAELKVRKGNYQTAIDLYKKALMLAPEREFISHRLQQLEKLSR